MALPDSNISTSLVGSTLGTSSRDVGTLCTHPSINKWSRWKPIRASKLTGITESDIIAASCGLNRNSQTQTIAYRTPRGGDYSTPEYYRLGDFRNYNHLATPPVNVEIVSVMVLPSGQYISGPPYTLVIGNQYVIDFKLIPGDIDPTWIDPQTSRIKNTNPDGGYGGLTWVLSAGGHVDQAVASADVFSCTVLDPPTLQQGVVAQTGDIRLQYCRYEGDSTGVYRTTAHWIEDDGFYDSYRSLFLIRNVSAGINFDSPFALFWDSIANQLQVRINVINNEEFPLNVKLRLNYTRLETSNEYSYNGSQFELSPNSSPNRFIPLQGWNIGTNTYEIRAWIYIVRPDLTEVEISYRMQTASITISTGA